MAAIEIAHRRRQRRQLAGHCHWSVACSVRYRKPGTTSALYDCLVATARKAVTLWRIPVRSSEHLAGRDGRSGIESGGAACPEPAAGAGALPDRSSGAGHIKNSRGRQRLMPALEPTRRYRLQRLLRQQRRSPSNRLYLAACRCVGAGCPRRCHAEVRMSARLLPDRSIYRVLSLNAICPTATSCTR